MRDPAEIIKDLSSEDPEVRERAAFALRFRRQKWGYVPESDVHEASRQTLALRTPTRDLNRPQNL